MAYIKNFAFCLTASNTEERQDISGLLSVMTPEYVPGLFSFSVFFNLLDLTEGDHEVQLCFRDEDGNLVVDTGANPIHFDRPENAVNIPVKYLGLNLSVAFQNVNVKHDGLYFMDAILDGEQLGSYDIYIKGKNEKK